MQEFDCPALRGVERFWRRISPSKTPEWNGEEEKEKEEEGEIVVTTIRLRVRYDAQKLLLLCCEWREGEEERAAPAAAGATKLKCKSGERARPSIHIPGTAAGELDQHSSWPT